MLTVQNPAEARASHAKPSQCFTYPCSPVILTSSILGVETAPVCLVGERQLRPRALCLALQI